MHYNCIANYFDNDLTTGLLIMHKLFYSWSLLFFNQVIAIIFHLLKQLS
jgi:hypothetical protein